MNRVTGQVGVVIEHTQQQTADNVLSKAGYPNFTKVLTDTDIIWSLRNENSKESAWEVIQVT